MTVTIRGNELTISLRDGKPHKVVEMSQTSEPITYYSLLSTRPDTSWRGVDAHDHEHRWVRDGESGDTPTCTSHEEHVPCDGSCGNWDCEGYDITVWECRDCGDRVEPGTSPDNGLKTLPGPSRMSVTIAGKDADDKLGESVGKAVPFVLYRGREVQARGMAHLVQHKSESREPFSATFDLRADWGESR